MIEMWYHIYIIYTSYIHHIYIIYTSNRSPVSQQDGGFPSMPLLSPALRGNEEANWFKTNASHAFAHPVTTPPLQRTPLLLQPPLSGRVLVTPSKSRKSLAHPLVITPRHHLAVCLGTRQQALFQFNTPSSAQLSDAGLLCMVLTSGVC